MSRVSDASETLLEQHAESNDAQSQSWMSYIALPALFVTLSVGDIVLGAILFDKFSEVYAQYLNQGASAHPQGSCP